MLTIFKLHVFSLSVCVLWNGFLFSYLTVYCLACTCYLTLAKQGRASQAQAKLEPLNLYRCVYIVMIYIPYTLEYSKSLQKNMHHWVSDMTLNLVQIKSLFEDTINMVPEEQQSEIMKWPDPIFCWFLHIYLRFYQFICICQKYPVFSTLKTPQKQTHIIYCIFLLI